MTYSLEQTLDYRAIKRIGEINLKKDHKFDLSKVRFAKPDGIVLLRLLLYKICNENGRKVRIKIPERSSSDYSVRRYLSHINFFDDLNITFSSKDLLYLKSRNFWPGERTSPTHTKLIDSRYYDLHSKMRDLVFVLINFLKENELIDKSKENVYRNVFEEAFLNQRNHSNPDSEPAYFCAQAQVYQKNPPQIVLSIGDCGVGIRSSLNTRYDFKSDKNALRAAVEEEKSRFIENEDRGGGVRFIFEKCRELNFNCLLRSGGAEIKKRRNFQKFEYNTTNHLPGTQLILWN